MDVRSFPALNAVLNTVSAFLLLAGYAMIRRGRREAHRRLMLAAFTVSVLFLFSYLTYHVQAGSVRFQGAGWIRPVYFTILISHSVLAAIVAPLAVVTLYRAWKGSFERHRSLARVTFPVWIYVSITGVVVYLMLYQL